MDKIKSEQVDFVSKKGRAIYSIEINSGRKRSSKGLDKFKVKLPTAKAIIIIQENYFIFEKDPMRFLEEA